MISLTESPNPLLVFKSFHFLLLLVGYSQSKEFPFCMQERQISLNNFNFCNSKFFTRNSIIECRNLDQTKREIFQTWQVFKEQLRKTIKDAITRICLENVNPNFYGKISPEILKNFWPINKLGLNPNEEESQKTSKDAPVQEELEASNFVNQRVMMLFKFIEQKTQTPSKVERPDKAKDNQRTTRQSRRELLRQFSKTSENSRVFSRSQYENNNPFLRMAKMDKRMSKQHKPPNRSSQMFGSNSLNEPLFDKECEKSLLYRQLIDEDKLENQNIQDFFKISRDSLPQHLLLLFMAHVDSLMLIMGPRKSIEFILPIYFTILNMNSIYHSNFKKINLERKPVNQ